MKKQKELPEGVQCVCGRFTPFNKRIYARWNTDTFMTCDCGRGYTIYRGIVEEL